MTIRDGSVGTCGEPDASNTSVGSPNAASDKPPLRTPRCFCNAWLLRDGSGRVHVMEPGEDRTDCGLLVNDDWRRLAKGTAPTEINCPVCLRVVLETA